MRLSKCLGSFTCRSNGPEAGNQTRITVKEESLTSVCSCNYIFESTACWFWPGRSDAEHLLQKTLAAAVTTAEQDIEPS
jgi:hypothetical protein